MQCRDSDVFALESSIEDILNNGEWKNINEINLELSKSKEESYQNWLIRKKSMFISEQADEVFYTDLMDRMCKLFPMKYKKNGNNQNIQYARTYSYNE